MGHLYGSISECHTNLWPPGFLLAGTSNAASGSYEPPPPGNLVHYLCQSLPQPGSSSSSFMFPLPTAAQFFKNLEDFSCASFSPQIVQPWKLGTPPNISG